MLRREEAIEFLLLLIAEGKIANAKAAIKALSIYQHDERLWSRVCQFMGSLRLSRESTFASRMRHPSRPPDPLGYLQCLPVGWLISTPVAGALRN
ncbi:MAG: hypothetical protein HC865_16040 [Cyanobacteria bacterium RU_5_0]|nr:hypothetical protein [Cyanobacteria bacterium RU_5_0]